MAVYGPIAAALAGEGCTAEQIAAAVIALESAREREREDRLARLGKARGSPATLKGTQARIVTHVTL